MAKMKMMCPFSNEPCKECALYRGRHYFLCFSRNYRGHLEEEQDSTRIEYPAWPRTVPGRHFEMPLIIATKAIDPHAIILEERKKGGQL